MISCLRKSDWSSFCLYHSIFSSVLFPDTSKTASGASFFYHRFISLCYKYRQNSPLHALISYPCSQQSLKYVGYFWKVEITALTLFCLFISKVVFCIDKPAFGYTENFLLESAKVIFDSPSFSIMNAKVSLVLLINCSLYKTYIQTSSEKSQEVCRQLLFVLFFKKV